MTRAEQFRKFCKDKGYPEPEPCGTADCPYCINHMCCVECITYWNEEVLSATEEEENE